MIKEGMRQVELEPRYYANKIVRLMFLSLEEVMGRNGVNALLNLAGMRHLVNNYPANDLKRQFSFRNFAEFLEAMHTMYGTRSGRAMELRAGRHAFKLLLKEFVPLLGLTDPAIKPLPPGRKISFALTTTAQIFNSFSDQITRVDEHQDHFLYCIDQCPMCCDRPLLQPSCFVMQGMLEEAMHWASGGRRFVVQETACRGMGAASCTFVIPKTPVDG